MDGLRGETDLSVAIIATAILEARLEKLLVRKFKIKKPDLVGQIFLNRGPLMDFHSKILIAHAFGIITSNLAEELHSIKSIRNTFAHAKFPVTFDHELIGREIDALQMLNAIKSIKMESEHKLELENKVWFLLATKLILIMFDSFDDHPGSGDDAIAEALKKDDAPTTKA